MAIAAEPVLTPRKVEIVLAATKVFADHGYRSGTVQLVAAEAGLSQAGLLHHFPNKDALLEAVLAYRERDDMDAMEAAAQDGESMISVLANVLYKNAQRPDMMRFLAVVSAEALSPEHPAHDHFQDRFDRLLSWATQAVAADQQSGTLRSDMPAEELARLIIAVADGLRYQVLVGSDPKQHWEHMPILSALLAGTNTPPVEPAQDSPRG